MDRGGHAGGAAAAALHDSHSNGESTVQVVRKPMTDAEKHELFGAGGGVVTAEKLGTFQLGQVPLVPEIRAGGDSGTPVVVGAPQSAPANVFREIAETLLSRLKPAQGARA